MVLYEHGFVVSIEYR